MPLWRIYTNPNTYTDEEKQALTNSITSVYTSPPTNLPPFYVIVAFVNVEPNDFFIGGVPVAKADKPFVRFQVEHLARTMDGETAQARGMARIEESLKPWTEGKGFDWEISILEGIRPLWRENGIPPPLPNTPAEKLWVKENKPSKYEDAQNKL